ncbi:MAG: hypothetical protein LC808_45010 [Actinobacteria bacterium]|nr:hypothetical protein [Actinomycetota bacterium]
MLNPFTAGQKLTAAADIAAFDQRRRAYQTADQTVTNSTTLVSSTSLVMAVAASVMYYINAQIFYDANTTADIKLSLLLPTGATVRLADPDPGATSSTSIQRTYQGIAAGTVASAVFSGIIDMDTTPGNLTLQFAQSALSATGTILKFGSTIELVQVA